MLPLLYDVICIFITFNLFIKKINTFLFLHISKVNIIIVLLFNLMFVEEIRTHIETWSNNSKTPHTLHVS